jgi:ATP-dependent DNA ligase
MATRTVARRPRAATLPKWIAPQLTQLVDAAPEGSGWLHEIKFDGYPCMRASIAAACGCTRTGLDWTNDQRSDASIVARQAYLDGELCGVGPDGITSFSMIQLASDAGNAAGLVFFLFYLLYAAEWRWPITSGSSREWMRWKSVRSRRNGAAGSTAPSKFLGRKSSDA